MFRLFCLCLSFLVSQTLGQVDPCGPDRPLVVLASEDVFLTSPGFSAGTNQTYPANANCSWLLQNDLSTAVELKFGNFSVEECTNCKCDSVEVDLQGVLQGRYCGEGVRSYPPTLTVGVNEEAEIRFSTDATGQYSGYVSRFGVPRDTDTPCSVGSRPLVITEGNGTFYSPNWPQQYPTGVQCQWLFQGQTGETWTFAFKQFVLEGACGNFDYVTIYDGDSTTDTSYGSFYGLVTPPVFTSRGPEVLVVFNSDISRGGLGFLAGYGKNI